MFGLSEGGTIAVLTGLGAALSTALGWAVRYVLGGKDAQIQHLEAEIAAGRSKVEALQEQQLKLIQDSLAEARKRAETDDRVARSLAEQTALLSKLAGTKS